MAVKLHQLGHCEGDVREKRDKGEKQMVEGEQRENREMGELTQHYQILVEEVWQTALRGWERTQPKTDTRNSNTHRLQLKQASPELRVEDF